MKSQSHRIIGLLVLLSINFSSLIRAQEYVPNYAEDYDFITKDGAWCWFSDPRAIYIDDLMVGGYVDKEGSIWSFSYDSKTGQKHTVEIYHKLEYDDHVNPSVMQLPDKRIVIFFSAHGGTKNSPMYYRISKNPKDISSWGELQEIDPIMEGRYGICYSNPAMLSDENNRIYLFFRGRDFKPTYIVSDDLCKTWSGATSLVQNDPEYESYGRPYVKYSTNNKDKIFIAFTDAHPRDRATNSIYFALYKGGKYMRANGEVIRQISLSL